MIDVVEILQHWHAGRPKAEVAASVGVDRGTVRKYVAPAEAAGLVPGGVALSRAEWLELVRGWFPELIDAKARSLTFGVINVHRDLIEAMLKTNKATTVWQRLRDEHGLTVSVTSFRRYVWIEFPDEVSADDATVLRPDVAPGSEAQIDYGYRALWPDPVSGRSRRASGFQWAAVRFPKCSSRGRRKDDFPTTDRQSLRRTFTSCETLISINAYGSCRRNRASGTSPNWIATRQASTSACVLSGHSKVTAKSVSSQRSGPGAVGIESSSKASSSDETGSPAICQTPSGRRGAERPTVVPRLPGRGRARATQGGSPGAVTRGLAERNPGSEPADRVRP